MGDAPACASRGPRGAPRRSSFPGLADSGSPGGRPGQAPSDPGRRRPDRAATAAPLEHGLDLTLNQLPHDLRRALRLGSVSPSFAQELGTVLEQSHGEQRQTETGGERGIRQIRRVPRPTATEGEGRVRLHTREVPGSIPGAPIQNRVAARKPLEMAGRTCRRCRASARRADLGADLEKEAPRDRRPSGRRRSQPRAGRAVRCRSLTNAQLRPLPGRAYL
jgi:hypothetical protein